MSRSAPRSSPSRRTAVLSVLVVGLVAAAGARVVLADDTPTLPPVSAQALLTSAIGASADPSLAISGSVTSVVDLGLPELPTSLGGSGEAGPAAVLLGRQGWKVWRSSDGVRIAHLLDLREQDLVASRHAAWFWDSATMTATRLVPASAPGGASMSADPALDPAALARAVIEGLGPCASLSVQGTATVAGRDTYVLALTPTTSDSRIGSVQIDIDAATRVPLRVAVVPVGTEDPAIEAGYTSVSFAPVDPSMFDFTPPPGATVRDAADLAPGPRTAAAGDGLPTITEVRALGSCAGTALAVRLDGPLPPDAAGLLPYEGPLASVVEVDRGDHVWLLAGLVDAGTLEDRAATLP